MQITNNPASQHEFSKQLMTHYLFEKDNKKPNARFLRSGAARTNKKAILHETLQTNR